jgi:hypothetical protein
MEKTQRSEATTAVGFTATKRSLLLSTGEVLPIEILYRKDGEPTQNIEEAEYGDVTYHDSVYRFSFSDTDQLTVH